MILAPGLRRMTVNLDSGDVGLYQGKWSVPEGVAVHSYLVEGERAVLIDPWFDGGYGAEELAQDLASAGLTWKNISAVAFTEAPPNEALADLKTWASHVENWGLPVSGAKHPLGNGAALTVHDGLWMAEPSRVVFTGRLLAGLGWMEDEVWGEDLDENSARWFEAEAQRWFALHPHVPAGWPLGGQAAPRHGLAWKDGLRAVERARVWSSWAAGAALPSLCLVWNSEDSERLDALVGGALDAGADLEVFTDSAEELAALAAAARRSSLIVAQPGLSGEAWKNLHKRVWRPAAELDAASLRAELVRQWEAAEEG